jgi:hypothetical protein
MPQVRLAKNPAGSWRQWMHSWTVCTACGGRSAGIMRRRGIVGVGAARFWPAAALALLLRPG